MIERAIENWLINTNEKNYQVAFCQVLLQKGHKVIYISSHRSMEQGKDIISIDNTGNYCAYQLKTGNIDINIWREIFGEVRELIEHPIIHPSVDMTNIHRAFLVTNGEVNDEVRLQITQMNSDNQIKNRKYAYLDIINRQTLLKEFIDVQGEFIPKELKEFDSFLKFFLSNGTDFFSKDKYSEFLNNIIFKDTFKQKSKVINAISSSIIITAYLLNPYQIKKNYYALFEAWVSLFAHIVRYAKRLDLLKKDWTDSLDLVKLEIVRNLYLFKDEVIERKDFLEGDWRGDGGLVYRARTTIVLGTLAALEVYLQMKEKKYSHDEKVLDLIKNNIAILFFWGESSFPYFLSLIKYLEVNNEVKIAEYLLNEIFAGVVNQNSLRNQNGFANPYYSVNDVLESVLGISTKNIDFSQFSGSSYILEIMMLMMVRRNRRDILEKNWQKLSHIQFKEFRADNIEDTFIWHIENGLNYSIFPKETQSWTELLKEANDFKEIPTLYSEYLDLMYFFILVYPHRINKLIIGLLDKNN